MIKQGFDNRIVSYEYIHSIDPKDFEKLINAIDPQPKEVILDAMCGYGAVGKAVLERSSGKADVLFLDESEVQIERAKKNIPELNEDHFIVQSLPHDGFKDAYFDKIVVKMGLHEVSLSQHLAILKEFKRILKPNGKVVVWDIMLNDETQTLFQDIIRKKDELSGFDLLTRERYFFREEEFIKNAQEAGFKTIQEFHPISYRFSSLRRLESELGGDAQKLEKLNSYIRERFTPELKEKLHFEDQGNDIHFNVTKKIFILEN